MPYLDDSMVKCLQESGVSNVAEREVPKKIRNKPSHYADTEAPLKVISSPVGKTGPPRSGSQRKPQDSDYGGKFPSDQVEITGRSFLSDLGKQNLSSHAKQLLYTCNLLKAQIKHLENLSPITENPKAFDHYHIHANTPLGEQPRSCTTIVKANHNQYKDFVLLCKDYDLDKVKIDPKKSFYLKVLRHLGKKHPGIIETWDIFHRGNNVLVLCEYAAYGSIENYLHHRGRSLHEKNAQHLAKQLYMAMDYLGDMGIAHRAIRPDHILVTHQNVDNHIIIKLTGFQKSVIYWNPEKFEFIHQPCVSISTYPKNPSYQPPEVYGEPGWYFNPVKADIWSFGACIYYFLTRKYPFDHTHINSHLEEEIMGNIDSLKISKHGQSFLKNILTIFSENRPYFLLIKSIKWISKVNI